MWCCLSGRSVQMGLQCVLQEFPCQSMSGKWIGLIYGQHLQTFLESNSFKQQVTKLVSNQLAWGCNTRFTRSEQQFVSCLECYVSASMLQDMPFLVFIQLSLCWLETNIPVSSLKSPHRILAGELSSKVILSLQLENPYTPVEHDKDQAT